MVDENFSFVIVIIDMILLKLTSNFFFYLLCWQEINYINNITDEEDSKVGLLNGSFKVAEFENSSNNMSVEEDNEALRRTEKMASTSEPSYSATRHNTQQRIITSKIFGPNLITRRKQTGKYKFLCHKCDYKSNKKNILANHMRTHTRERPFACSVCEYKARYKSRLTQHMLIHLEKYKFYCDNCDFRTNQKYDLVRHMRTHTGERPFACSLCDFKATQKSNLTRHMLIHSEKYKF